MPRTRNCFYNTLATLATVASTYDLDLGSPGLSTCRSRQLRRLGFSYERTVPHLQVESQAARNILHRLWATRDAVPNESPGYDGFISCVNG
ncbi:hypothetical protein RJ035_002518 [Blastomyces gilchristii]